MTVGLNDPGLALRQSPGARGRMSARAALRHILAGTGASFIDIDARTIRIVRARPAPPPARPRPSPRVSPPLPAPTAQPEIIVTASKQGIRLRDYAGTVSILTLDPDRLAREGAEGTAAIVDRLPVLASTNLGPGRNKLFVRGVADSSFNGSSPATVGQYLGDVRLTYSAPDPDLNLYDMQSVELLEGPQGTLYGTGALGGIIRLVPNAPDASSNEGSISVGGVTVAHGGEGYDSAGMLNLVMIPDKVAFRGVAYATGEPGYIDDPSRGLADINRTKSRGGRVALQLQPGGWTVTLGGASQNISARDGQYILRGTSGLERRNALAQPFDNDFGLGYLTASKRFGATELTSTISIVRHDIDSQFDATMPDGPLRLFEEQLAIRLLSHETRLSHQSANGSWIVGISGLSARNRATRSLGSPDVPDPIAGVRNIDREAALFGQYSRRLTPHLTATLGGRLSYAHSRGDLLDDGGAEADEPTRSQLRVSPTAALSWQVGDRLLAFVHLQSAFRPGLLEVAPDGAKSGSQRVAADSLSMAELGARFGQRGRDPLSFSTSLSIARWTDIQSDLIDANGLPTTSNIGDGIIKAFEAQASWLPDPSLLIDASLLFDTSRLARPVAAFAKADERELPNVAHFGARIEASYAYLIGRHIILTVNAAARYVGSSALGIGAPLDVSQGNYIDSSAGARISRGAVGVSLDLTNVFDVRGNRFSYGNPFGIDQRNQVTPLVPRRLRLGINVRF